MTGFLFACCVMGHMEERGSCSRIEWMRHCPFVTMDLLWQQAVRNPRGRTLRNGRHAVGK